MQMERPRPTEDSRFRILAEIRQQITSILDINELLVQVVRLIQRTFNYFHVGTGIFGDHPNFQFKPQRLNSTGATGWVAHTSIPDTIPTDIFPVGDINLIRKEQPITFGG